MGVLSDIFKGFTFFFIGYFITLLLFQIIPELISAGNTIFDTNGDIEFIVWTIVLSVSVLLMLLAPNFYILRGIRELPEQFSSFQGVAIGAFTFFIFLLLTIKTYYMFEILYNLTSDSIVQILFFLGLITAWLEMQLIIPAYLVFNSIKK